ncbi:hypothetical protein [Streptomyces sp. NPDC020607]
MDAWGATLCIAGIVVGYGMLWWLLSGHLRGPNPTTGEKRG